MGDPRFAASEFGGLVRDLAGGRATVQDGKITINLNPAAATATMDSAQIQVDPSTSIHQRTAGEMAGGGEDGAAVNPAMERAWASVLRGHQVTRWTDMHTPSTLTNSLHTYF